MNELVAGEHINSEDIRYEIENINFFNNKIVPYNSKSKIPLHKFWVYIDKCKIVKKVSYCDHNSVIAGLSLSSESIVNIKSIEKSINKKLIEDEITRFILISKLFDSGSGVPTLEFVIDSDTKLFCENDKKIQNIETLSQNTELSVLCELDYFLLTNNCLKTSWKAIQLKKIQSINLLESLFPKTCESDYKFQQCLQQSPQQFIQVQQTRQTQQTQQTRVQTQTRQTQQAQLLIDKINNHQRDYFQRASKSQFIEYLFRNTKLFFYLPCVDFF